MSLQDGCQRKTELDVVFAGNISMLAIFTYDYLLTLSREVEFMWLGSFHFTTLLYFMSRYLPFFPLVFFFVTGSIHSKQTMVCTPLLRFIDVLSIFSRTAITVVLIVQTYAMYNKNRIILGFLGALALAIVIIDGFQVAADGCGKLSGTLAPFYSRQRLALIILTTFSVMVMGLTLYKVFGLVRQKHNICHSFRSGSLPRLILYEGLCMSAVCALRIFDVFLIVFPPLTTPYLGDPMQDIDEPCIKPIMLPIAAIFITHFLLSLRHMQMHSQDERTTTSKSVEFTTIRLGGTPPALDSAFPPDPAQERISTNANSIPFPVPTSKPGLRAHESWIESRETV